MTFTLRIYVLKVNEMKIKITTWCTMKRLIQSIVRLNSKIVVLWFLERHSDTVPDRERDATHIEEEKESSLNIDEYIS